ncbi:MAG TPA: protein kinase [Gemmatimonadaceae bacterium]
MTPPVHPELVGDRYRIEREIARGGMATVYLANDLRHDRAVALKVMHPEVALALGRERFLREIRLAAKLSHPNILTVHDSGEAGDLLYYVMPYVEGESLRHYMEQKGPLPVDESVRLTKEAAEAIGYAHSLGIIHRDIKPENILLSRGHAVVCDFGIARALDAARDDRLTGSGMAIGTPTYMSPEQALVENVDERSDVWALGCLLYEMLSGKPPFGTGGREVITRALTARPDPLRDSRPDVPENIERIIDKAVARNPDVRFSSATELAEALETYRTAEIPVSPPRNRKTGLAVAAGVVAILAIAGSMLLPGDTSAPAAPAARAPKLSSDSAARELYRLGKAQMGLRTSVGIARAIALHSQAIARDSSFAAAWAELSRAATFAHRRGLDVSGFSPDSLLHLAVNASQRAVDLDPENAIAWLAKARIARLVDPSDLTAALKDLRRSMAIDSMNADAWFELGLIHQDLLDDKAVLSDWMRATTINPSDAQTVAFIALHYMWNEQYSRAKPWADSSIALQSTYVLARQAATQIAMALGNPADAQRHAEAEIQITTGREQALAFASMARALAAQGDTTAARAFIERSLKLFDPTRPNSHEAAYVAAGIAAVGDTSRALQLLSAYQPRADLHYQLHLKRDPGLRWLRQGYGKNLLRPSPPR